MKLVERSLGPPGGWKYTQPESGVMFTGISYAQLLEKIRKHRRSNQYDTQPGWEERFEEDFCKQNRLGGTQWCPLENGEPKAERRLGLNDVRRFLHTVQAAIKAGGDVFVEQEEADRRAVTCAECRQNAVIPGCFGCNGLASLISKARGQRTTVHDSRLRQCTVCGCVNKVKVWVKESVIDSEGLDFPDNCWLKKSSPETDREPAD